MSTVTARDAVIIPEESSVSAVSWAAVAAGGVVSAAFTLFLLHLVAGLGLVSVSPWSGSGASATTLHVAGGIALVLTAVMASALGGYLAARLRTRWVGIHTDEVYFRDSAHGVLAWAFATLVGATVLVSAAGGIVSSVTQGATANPALVPDRNAYLVDTLFRSDRPATSDQPTRRPPTEKRPASWHAALHPVAILLPQIARASHSLSPNVRGCHRRKPNNASMRRSRRRRLRRMTPARPRRNSRSGSPPRCSRVALPPGSAQSKAAGCATICKRLASCCLTARLGSPARRYMFVPTSFELQTDEAPADWPRLPLSIACPRGTAVPSRQRQNSARRRMIGRGMPSSHSSAPFPKPIILSCQSVDLARQRTFGSPVPNGETSARGASTNKFLRWRHASLARRGASRL